MPKLPATLADLPATKLAARKLRRFRAAVRSIKRPRVELPRPEAKDFTASLVVFFIAMPLSLGIALASGAPIVAGLVAAIVGGLVVGPIGGSPMRVAGPAAGLTVVVADVIGRFGWPTALLITALAGLLQIGFGTLRIARVSLAISPAVVHGMLAGIGLVIALGQAHVVLGGKPESSALKNLLGLPGQILDLHGASAQLGVLAFLILVVWSFLPKKAQAIPGPLVAVVIPTLVSLRMVDAGLKRVVLPDSLVPKFELPGLSADLLGPIAVAAFTVAIVASINSLLVAVAVDAMHTGERADLDKELVAQGIGNIAAGALGGIPVTGVIVRSSANIAAGARTPWSNILHGAWVLVFALVGRSVIERIPLSVLAGLLVYVGIRLIKVEQIRELAKHRELAVYVVTVAGVVGKDLLFGVGAGFALAMYQLIRRMSHVQIERERMGDELSLKVDGSLTFLSVPKLTAAFQKIPDGVPVKLDMHTDLMDHAAFDFVHSWVRTRREQGGRVRLVEHHDEWYSLALGDAPKAEKTPISEAGTREGREVREEPVPGEDALLDGDALGVAGARDE